MSLRDSQANPANNLPLVIIVSLALLFCTALPLSLNPQNVPLSSQPSARPIGNYPSRREMAVGGRRNE